MKIEIYKLPLHLNTVAMIAKRAKRRTQQCTPFYVLVRHLKCNEHWKAQRKPFDAFLFIIRPHWNQMDCMCSSFVCTISFYWIKSTCLFSMNGNGPTVFPASPSMWPREVKQRIFSRANVGHRHFRQKYSLLWRTTTALENSHFDNFL